MTRRMHIDETVRSSHFSGALNSRSPLKWELRTSPLKWELRTSPLKWELRTSPLKWELRTSPPKWELRTIRNGRENGTILVVILWISATLVSTALLFGHSMMLEYRAADNTVAGFEATQAIEGAARYVAYLLKNAEEPGRLPDVTTYESEAVALDEGRFWLLGRGTDEQEKTRPVFGLIDEASKLNLNTATREMLEALRCMTPELAAAIIDWRDTDTELSPDGAESQNYLLRNPKYNCKDSNFETVEELRLLAGADWTVLYGEDANQNGVLDPNEDDGDETPPEDNRDGRLDPGVLEYVTVWSRESNTRADGTARVSIQGDEEALRTALEETLGARAQEILAAVGTNRTSMRSLLEFYIRSQMTPEEFAQVYDALSVTDDQWTSGLINVNTASAAVLACIPGIGEANAETLVAYRQGKQADDLATVAWVAQALDEEAAIEAGPYLTTRSSQFAADVAAVGHGGRGFRRVLFVIEMNGTEPRVAYRRDRSRLGWPLGAAIRQEIASTTSEERRYR